MKVPHSTIFFITFAALAMLCSPLESRGVESKVTTIVIDPGHGGKHPGTVWGKYYEKDITLSVALMLGDMIKENLPDVKVVFTRTEDKYVDLVDRGKIANAAGADLFLSIHVNGSPNNNAVGASSYVMGNDSSERNLEVAMRENDVVSIEENYTTKYEGFIPGSPESYIIFSLMQYAYSEQSMAFATIIQQHYKSQTAMKDRGTGYANFLVLWRTSMPSVLTEIGFLTNEHDRNILITKEGQRKSAVALFNALSQYKSTVEKRSQTVFLSDDSNNRPSDNSAEPDKLERPQLAPPVIVDSLPPQSSDQSKPSGKQSETDKQSGSNIRFYVQIATFSQRMNPQNERFGTFKGKVKERKVGEVYKYYVGGSSSYRETYTLMQSARNQFKDAFMVAFDGDKPMALAQARKLLNQ